MAIVRCHRVLIYIYYIYYYYTINTTETLKISLCLTRDAVPTNIWELGLAHRKQKKLWPNLYLACMFFTTGKKVLEKQLIFGDTLHWLNQEGCQWFSNLVFVLHLLQNRDGHLVHFNTKCTQETDRRNSWFKMLKDCYSPNYYPLYVTLFCFISQTIQKR